MKQYKQRGWKRLYLKSRTMQRHPRDKEKISEELNAKGEVMELHGGSGQLATVGWSTNHSRPIRGGIHSEN